jgi:hypothetical protein
LAGVDPPLPGTEPDQKRALGLLFGTAALALEGGRRGKHGAEAPIHAAIPAHAARSLDGLHGAGTPCSDVATFIRELKANEGRPTEVDAGMRVAHLGLQAVVLSPGLITMFLVAFPARAPLALETPILIAWPLLWLVWAALMRGGWLLRPFGMAVARFDSRPAERWRCGIRAALAWLPATASLLVATWIRHSPSGLAWLCWLNWGAALAILLSAIPLAVASPARLPHDRMTGTWLVPN